MTRKRLGIMLFIAMVLSIAARANAKEWVGMPQPEPKKIIIGSLHARSEYTFALELTNRGAAINTLKLADHFATVNDKRLFDKDPQAYEKQWPQKGKSYQGHYSLLNPVSMGRSKCVPLATRGVKIALIDQDKKTIEIDLKNLYKKSWKLAHQSADSATFMYQVARSKTATWEKASKDIVLQISKTYTISKNDYTVMVSLKIENLSSLPARITVDQGGPTGLGREGVRSDARSVMYGRKTSGKDEVHLLTKPVSELTKKEEFAKLGKHVVVGTTFDAEPTKWIGHLNQYFGSMMYLADDPRASWDGKFYAAAAEESDTSRAFATGIIIENITLKPHSAREIHFELFAGPKKRELFANDNHPRFRQRYKELNYLSTINMGACFCAFNWLTLAMMWLLGKLSIVAMGNYGVAIILLVIMVRIALHPLTKKSQVSMMKMQKLGPQMQKLKEKYADDKDTLNKEMMKFYKQQGTTPLLGCLPMMLQMPLWIALWTSVQGSVELRHAAFLPIWIIDLAAPDRLFTWSESLPLIGTSFNLLPILLTVAMFFQTKLNPQMGSAGSAAASDQQKQQQKMMQYMMPVMMLFFFYSAPSGLTLYIMTSTFAGVTEQFIIRGQIRDKDATEAAMETTVALPGKGPRGSRTKKPKGPNWTKHG